VIPATDLDAFLLGVVDAKDRCLAALDDPTPAETIVCLPVVTWRPAPTNADLDTGLDTFLVGVFDAEDRRLAALDDPTPAETIVGLPVFT
jgi:hypothetical protein